jgi:predicted DNA-binding transcriptional regulator AlpA
MMANRAQFAQSSADGMSHGSTSSSKLLTAEEVAEITGLSVETLAQWRSQKRGSQFVRISRNFVRYWQSDLDAWLAERIVRTDETRRNGGS